VGTRRRGHVPSPGSRISSPTELDRSSGLPDRAGRPPLQGFALLVSKTAPAAAPREQESRAG